MYYPFVVVLQFIDYRLKLVEGGQQLRRRHYGMYVLRKW